MSATYLRDGKRIVYSNTGSAISAGDVVSIAVGATGMIGVAVVDIAATTGTGAVDIEGVFTFVKTAGEAFTQGQLVYWDGSATTGTSSSTFTRAGRVTAAAGSSATTANVKINQP